MSETLYFRCIGVERVWEYGESWLFTFKPVEWDAKERWSNRSNKSEIQIHTYSVYTYKPGDVYALPFDSVERPVEADRFSTWFDDFTRALKIPSGLDYVDAQFIADRVTEFLTSLQLMNRDAYEAGKKEPRDG